MSRAAGVDGREHARTSYRMHAIGKTGTSSHGFLPQTTHIEALVSKLVTPGHHRLDAMLPWMGRGGILSPRASIASSTRKGNAKIPLFGNGSSDAGRLTLYPIGPNPRQRSTTQWPDRLL